MRRPWSLSLSLVIAVTAGRAQTTNSAHTTGNCSSSLAGTGNQVTINCSGISPAKANQMILLMNKILAENLDMKQVSLKLDDIGSQIENINETINPLANAPIEVVRLFEESQKLSSACMNLEQEWSGKTSDRQMSALREQQSQAQNFAARAAEAGNAVAANELDAYRKTLMPRLIAFDARIRAALGQQPAPNSYENVKSGLEIQMLGRTLEAMVSAYERQQARLGRTPDASLRKDATALATECTAFDQQWRQAGSAAHQMPTSNQFAVSDQVSIEESKKYKETLESKLVSFRERARPYIPDYTSSVDYDQVTSVRQLGRVCVDIMQMQAAYQQKHQNDIQEKNAAKNRTR